MLKKKNIGLTMLACFLWASAFPTVKTLFTELNIGSSAGEKILLAGYRFLLAGVLILSYYTIKYRSLPIIKEPSLIARIFCLGLLQTGVMYYLFYIGIYNTSGVKTAVISQVGIFLVVILSHFVFEDDRITINKIVGVLFGLIGVILVNINGFGTEANLFQFSVTGEGFILLSSLCGAIGTIMAKLLGKKINPILMTGWQMTSGAVVLIAIGLMLGAKVNVVASPKVLVIFIYSAIISSVAFSIWYTLLQNNRASDITIYRFTIPIMGALLSAMLLPGEGFNGMIIVGLAFVSYGIFYCNRVKVKD